MNPTKENKEINFSDCKHEIDENSLKYDKEYGRVGVCKKCNIKMYRIKINSKPKRTKPKMKKKLRRRLRNEQKKANSD